VQAEIAAKGLDNIRFSELLPREKLGQGLAEGDIHLVPQEPDGAAFAVPSKIYNIMAAGRPFVATARPDSPLWHLQTQSRAFLCVPPNDTPAFADAVLRLADDRPLRAELGRNGRAFVEEHYAKGKVLTDLVMRIDALYA
jgi:colanic acid biosynthesis glycosyl transferase WcaI